MVTNGRRWGMSKSFIDAGYECTFGDIMFGLGMPIALHTVGQLKTLAGILMPVVGRLPFSWVYPTGEKQEKRIPKYQNYYHSATVVTRGLSLHQAPHARRHARQGHSNQHHHYGGRRFVQAVRHKVSCNNYAVLDGRSFGTNMMEAAMVAISGKGRPLTAPEYEELITKLKFGPQLQELN